MKVQVLDKNVIRVDSHGACIFLIGDREVDELIKALTSVLFKLCGLKAEEVPR